MKKKIETILLEHPENLIGQCPDTQSIISVMDDPLSFWDTREALLSEAGFEKLFRTQNWSVGASCFVDDLVSCWGKRGAYRLLLEPS